MYKVSKEFSKAVYSRGVIVRPLIRFLNDNTFLTGEDIQLSGGLTVTEYLNTEEDLTIGCAPSSQLQTTILNVGGFLDDFSYGECKVFLGARVSENAWSRGNSTCTAILGYGTSKAIRFDAYPEPPYLKTNNTESNVQPPEALQSILIYGNAFYGILPSGDVWYALWDGSKLVTLDVSTWDDLRTTTWDEIAKKRWLDFSSLAELSPFMKTKLKKWKGKGFWYDSEICYDFQNTKVEKYEYVPLGVFIADTPAKRRTLMVNLTAQDRMKKFDQDATSWWNSLNWPLTVKQILNLMCSQVGVPLGTSGDFLNSSRRFATAPLVAEALTYRDILRWIAGGSGGYARFTRDGYLELAWFDTQPIDIPQNQYFSDYEISEYTVPQISGMQILNATDDLGVLLGNKGNVYQMMDNPIFYGATENDIRAIGAPVFLRLNSFATYAPMCVRAVSNWAIQAGDIIKVNNQNLPIFIQTIVYNGGVRSTYQSTGQIAREVISASERKVFQQKRAIHQLQIDLLGIHSHIEDTDSNVADLELTAAGLKTQIENAEGDITSLEATTNSLGVRVSNTEGDVSTLKLSLSGLQSQVSGKIDGSTAQSMIDQSIGNITLSVSSSNGSSTFTLKAGQAELSTDTLNLTVNAVNVSGTISGNQVDATTLRVNGANIYNLNVTNAQIENLECAKLIGYMPAARLSDPTKYLSDFYVNHVISNGYLAILVNGDIDQGYELNASGIKHAGSTTLWSTILSGGNAVFG